MMQLLTGKCHPERSLIEKIQMRFRFFPIKKTIDQPKLPLSFHRTGNRRNALIIYVKWAVEEWLAGNWREENWNSHSMHWESIEMVKVLSLYGYNVDYLDCMASHLPIDWSKYELVIDERNHLTKAPSINGQKRIHYATGCQWLFHNTAEWRRLLEFRNRYGISLPPQRQMEPILAEATADVVTYFGGSFQKNTFTNPQNCFPLHLSSSFVPAFKKKDVRKARGNLLWMGSRGFIHKGLDIVLEVVKKRPEFTLHICTDLQIEPDFYNWYVQTIAGAPNLIYHGWKDVNDPAFQRIAEECLASVYCSAAEGGAGAVIQCMQFGCIPVVGTSTALRTQDLGFVVEGETAAELVISIGRALDSIAAMTDSELEEQSAAVRRYANQHHSRQAYNRSFSDLIELVSNE